MMRKHIEYLVTNLFKITLYIAGAISLIYLMWGVLEWIERLFL